MNDDIFIPFDNDDVSPLNEIAEDQEREKADKEREEKERERNLLAEALETSLKPLIQAVNKTNDLISLSDSNTQGVKGAVESLEKALFTEKGENISDYITEQLERHQKALANSGIDKLTETWDKQSASVKKQMESQKEILEDLKDVLNNLLGELDRSLTNQNVKIDEFSKKADNLSSALAQPKEAVLDSGDRYALENVGTKVSRAIEKQKWWWVGWGIGVILSLFLSGWGIYGKITAENKLKEAQRIYVNHEFTWKFWHYMEDDWGKKNPKTYKDIMVKFKKRYPSLSEQYERENPNVVRESKNLK